MAEKVQSIASNLIDPTNYGQGGGVVDGKLRFENIPEDWVMFVQLYVRPRSRSVLLKTNDDRIIASDNQEYLVANIPYYNQTVNKNTSGTIIPFDIQTTEYTDIFGAKGLEAGLGGTSSTLGQESAFGMTNIDIDFNDVRQPSIEINFVDVRGAGLMSYGPTGGLTKSPYSWFFLLPYPEFCLKVKGFYGKTISIPCLLHKFDMKYNNSTGNFDITTKFIGYPFSVMNDLNIKIIERMCCIPGGLDELENTYNKLVKCLDPQNPDDRIILQELPKVEDLCIYDYLRAIESSKTANPIQTSFDTATRTSTELTNKYKTLIKEYNSLISLVRDNGGSNKDQLYNKFGSVLLESRILESEFQELYNTSSNTDGKINKYRGLGGVDSTNVETLAPIGDKTTPISIKNFSHYTTDKKLPDSLFKPITLDTSKSYFDPCYGSSDTVEQNFKDGINKILLDNSTDIDKITKVIETHITQDMLTDAMNSGSGSMNAVEKTLIMLREQYQNRLTIIDNYQIFLCNFFQTTEKTFKTIFTETEKVRPTIQRLITLIAINVEAFLNLMLKVSVKAEKYHEDHKETATYTAYFTDASNQAFVNKKGLTNNKSTSLRGVKLYAWPKTYKINEEGNKVEAFPTELNSEFSEWPEVMFTKSVIDAIASNECKHDKLIETTGGGLSRWKSLNMFEDAPFALNVPLNSSNDMDSPYNNELLKQYFSMSNTSDKVDDNERENKLKQLITSRAILNLYHFNHLFEQDENISSTNSIAYDTYVKELAQRDADILFSTMSECNLLKLLSDKFSSDAGVTLLKNYCNTTIPLTFSKNLTYTAPVNLETPYGMLFLLGNNNLKVKVTDDGIKYNRRRSTNEDLNDVLTNNFYGLSYYDNPQYPFTKYVTLYLDIPGFGTSIINGYEYDDTYTKNNLNLTTSQGVIYNYNPWYQSTSSTQITPPLGIPLTTIANADLPRNIYYNKNDVTRYVTYEPFLNPSHIRDINVFGLNKLSKLPYEQTTTIDPTTPATPIFETGNGIPSWSTLVGLLSPVSANVNKFPIGINAFNSYKIFSKTQNAEGAVFKNDFHPTNRFDVKTYYMGIDPLLSVLGNSIRTYHTTYNHYPSDILKSFLYDPYKTKIGNTKNKLGNQEKSIYNIVTNLTNQQLRSIPLVNYNNQISELNSPVNTPLLMSEYRAGSNWDYDPITKNDVQSTAEKSNVGFHNSILYSTNIDVLHKSINKNLPVLYHLHSTSNIKNPSLIQYLFLGEKTTSTNTTIPRDSKWLKEFGESGYIGADYDGNTFTMVDIFGNKQPFNDLNFYFLNYSDLINDESKGLLNNSLYDIPVDMNSTWFRNKMREYDKKITPVKKYQTTYMKKLSYLIWKEATMRILSMCEINLNTGKNGLTNGGYYKSNYQNYSSVYLYDIPSKNPGGPTTSTKSVLFDDTYPQSKFYNKNIDIFNRNPNYNFYGFSNDKTGTYVMDPSGLLFDGSKTPGPNGENAPYPNNNPTDSFIPYSGLTNTQPPLLTLPQIEYSSSMSNPILKTAQWSRLYIHQTNWWSGMTTDLKLTKDTSIDERKAMKTYLTLMSLWGANSMDALVYNYPLMSPASGLFRVNNLDLVTLGAFLWASESKLKNNTGYVHDVITAAANKTFSCGIPDNLNLILDFGDPTKSFPFNNGLKDLKYSTETFDRWYDYGIVCTPGNKNARGETNLNPGASLINQPEQNWQMIWGLGETPKIYDIKPNNLAADVKRDLVNNFLQFVETSEFSRNIDDNLNSLSMLREIAETALATVEDNISEGDKAYHRFPFDIEQTLLMWGDWASIVDLNDTTKEFKSYYDFQITDGWRVKRPEQKVVLSSKLFDMLSIESSDGTLDHPYKEVKTYVDGNDTFYYSPWIRINGKLLMLKKLSGKDDIAKKIMLKLLKVVTYEEQIVSNVDIPIITKRDGKFETILNYKQSGSGKTLAGNDQNYFFEHLFKGFYYPTIYGGMRTTSSSEYNPNNLCGQKLYLSKSWGETKIKGISDDVAIKTIINTIPNSNRLDTYFKTLCTEISKLSKSENFSKCDKNTKAGSTQRYRVDLENDSLPYYRSFKNLFNRWLAGTTEEDHTYHRSGCNAIIGGTSCRSLVKNIYIVDRVNRPAGDKVCPDTKFMTSFFNNNPTATVMGFLSELITKDAGGIGGSMVEYPVFFNFGNSGINLEDNPGKAMWGMTTIVDEKDAGPAIVIYVQKPDQAHANAELNSYVNEELRFGMRRLAEDFSSPDSRGVIFKVAISNENNNIFTGLQVDTTEFKETWESIRVADEIGKQTSTNVPKFIDQNVYNLWTVRSWTANIECFGNMLIQPGMYFYLEDVPIFEGTYIIKKVSHSIEPHNIKTKFWGSRVNHIPSPYASKDAVGSFFRCNQLVTDTTVDVISNDPGYCKQTMLDILDAFTAEVNKVLGLTDKNGVIVYTSDEFLTSLGFSEDDSKKFYNKYDVMVRKDGTSKPFDNVRSIDVNDRMFTAEFSDINFSVVDLPKLTNNVPLPNSSNSIINRQTAMSFFMGVGWTKEQAAGIVANLIGESGLQTIIYNKGGSGAFGLAQWLGVRKTKLAEFTKKDVEQTTIDDQLRYVQYELTTTEINAGNKLKLAKTPEDAADVVLLYYERPSDSEKVVAQPQRRAWAKELMSVEINSKPQ